MNRFPCDARALATVAMIAWTSLLGACKAEPKKEEPPPASSVTAAETVPPPGSASAMPPYPGRALSLGDKMNQEAAARSAGALRAEAVFEAFQKDGMKLKAPPKQHMGSPVGATYCAGATSEANLAMSVCEYRSDAEAKKGREDSVGAFKAIPNRDVYQNKQTTLTILQNPKGPESEAESKRIVAQFAKM